MKHFRYYARLLFLLFSVNGITKNSRCGFMGFGKKPLTLQMSDTNHE